MISKRDAQQNWFNLDSLVHFYSSLASLSIALAWILAVGGYFRTGICRLPTRYLFGKDDTGLTLREYFRVSAKMGRSLFEGGAVVVDVYCIRIELAGMYI